MTAITDHLHRGFVAEYLRTSKPNGYRVAIDALAEVGRLDLGRFLFSSQNLTNTVYIPHFDGVINPPIIIEDIALIEKAMRIGFASVKDDYSCTGCEVIFRNHGVTHGKDLMEAMC